jgi:hypothetical protein
MDLGTYVQNLEENAMKILAKKDQCTQDRIDPDLF